MIRLLLLSFAILLPNHVCPAGGLFQQLPSEGTWTEFLYRIERRRGADPSDAVKARGTLRVSVLNAEEHNGERFRWLEFDSRQQAIFGGRLQEARRIVKLLVAESQLRGDGTGNKHVLRGYETISTNGEDAPVYDVALSGRNLLTSPHQIFLVGPLDDQQELKPQLVSVGDTPTACPGVAGKFTVNDWNWQGPVALKGAATIHMHPSSPFGIATFRAQAKHQQDKGDSFELELVYLDSGIRASSQLANTRPRPAANVVSRSPFEKVWRGESDELMVQVSGQSFELIAIDDLSVRDLVTFLKTNGTEFRRKNWQLGFVDIVFTLFELGRPTNVSHLQLTLRPIDSNETVFRRTPLTLNNYLSLGENSRTVRRDPEQNLERVLSKDEMTDALNDFEDALQRGWSFYPISNADYEASISELHARISTGLTTGQFRLELQKIISLGSDGHAGVGSRLLESDRFLPFQVEPSGADYVAFLPNRTAFLREGFPLITAIDGKPIDDWIDNLSVVTPRGSRSFIRIRALSQLRDLPAARRLLDLEQSPRVVVSLTSADKCKTKDITLSLVEERTPDERWPKQDSHLRQDNIGYLRIHTMSSASPRRVAYWMNEFRNTTGLIVDVRGNPGGMRETLQVFASHVIQPDEAWVGGCSVFRLGAFNDDDWRRRLMLPLTSNELTPVARNAVLAFRKEFRPESTPSPQLYSDWFYLVLQRMDLPDVYYYDKPIVILMNERSYSAADVFLAALKRIPQITLVGTPSSGSSSARKRIPLGDSGIDVSLGCMLAFQPNGKLFDGNGVQPDITVFPDPEYFIGGRDNVLDNAIQIIQSKQPVANLPKQ